MTIEFRVSATNIQLDQLTLRLNAAPVRACVWSLPEKLSADALELLQEQCGPFDYVQCLPGTQLNHYSLLVSDMDSTLITIECIDEIADFCGRKAEVAAITEATMRGEIASFEESLRKRVAILAGLSANALQSVYDERLQLSPGVQSMLASLKSAGIATLLVSGGFTFFTERLQKRLGLNRTLANQLEIVDDKLTGVVTGRIVDGSVKAEALLSYCKELEISPSVAIAAGDGSNDLLMMREAGLSLAFHAKPVVKKAANMVINCGGLDRLPYLLAL